MTALTGAGLWAILLASLLGSLHCVVMCGPLAALHHGSPAQRRRSMTLHQLGRGLGYALLGTLAGAAGRVVDLAGAALSLQRTAMIVSAGGLAIWAGWLAGTALRSRSRTLRPTAAPSWFGRGLVQLRARPPARRALGLGLLNALLPCGWLWAFVALAASTGAALTGAATMLVFWLGTLPALFGVASLAGPLLTRLRPRWPLVTATLVLGLAGTALLLRMPLLHSQGTPAPTCHSEQVPR
jgi:uncharacterized protein